MIASSYFQEKESWWAKGASLYRKTKCHKLKESNIRQLLGQWAYELNRKYTRQKYNCGQSSEHSGILLRMYLNKQDLC